MTSLGNIYSDHPKSIAHLLIGCEATDLTNAEVVSSAIETRTHPNFVCGYISSLAPHQIVKEILVSHTLIWTRAVQFAKTRYSVNGFSKLFILTFTPYLENILEKMNKETYLKAKDLTIKIKDETNFTMILSLVVGPPLYRVKKEITLDTFFANVIFHPSANRAQEHVTLSLDI